MDSNRYYIVGPVSNMHKLFPDYKGNDERYSVDGSQVVYEVRFTQAELDTFLSTENTGVKLMTHAEALEFLNAPEAEGIWYQKSEDVVE